MNCSALTIEELEYILRHMEELESENEMKITLLKSRFTQFQKQGEVITMEESMLTASLSAVSYGEKVQSSGSVEHDELFRILEESKRAYQRAMLDLQSEYTQLAMEFSKYSLIRKCINKMGIKQRRYIESYYLKNRSLQEIENIFEVSNSTAFRWTKTSLRLLYDLYMAEINGAGNIAIARNAVG